MKFKATFTDRGLRTLEKGEQVDVPLDATVSRDHEVRSY
jgi:hypothetical protein